MSGLRQLPSSDIFQPPPFRFTERNTAMIRIMVDSTADCRKEDGLDLRIVPIAITINDRQYFDGVDLDKDTFYNLLTSSQDFPKTSQPSPQVFADIYEEIQRDGDELIYISISSTLSGTYQSACIAKNMVGYEKIHIIDSRTATHAIGLLARHALSLRDAGKTAGEIVDEIESMKSRVKIIAVVDTLEYLFRGGRLNRMSATIGQITNVKPILTVTEEGTVVPIGKCIGRSKSIQFLLKQLQSIQPAPDFPVYSLFSFGQENCDALEEALSSAGYPTAKRLQIGASIGTHTGPGVCGVMFVAKA